MSDDDVTWRIDAWLTSNGDLIGAATAEAMADDTGEHLRDHVAAVLWHPDTAGIPRAEWDDLKSVRDQFTYEELQAADWPALRQAVLDVGMPPFWPGSPYTCGRCRKEIQRGSETTAPGRFGGREYRHKECI